MNQLNPLQSYNFNSNDFFSQGMNKLKELFLNNGYLVYRWPEIYLDDYDVFKNNYGEIRSNNENTPDYLAVYTDFGLDGEKEGIVVLFKDRIHSFCKRKKLNFDDVCFVVLMHELGHWLTHWPLYNGESWTVYYGNNDIKTHESLAQLIAYWMVDGNQVLEKILNDDLTPNNINDPYYLYNNLKRHSKSLILKKLSEFRWGNITQSSFGGDDDEMYDYLASDAKTREEWLETHESNF
jgi:hypothetical protein